jgi:hypothetical protein
MLRIVRFRFELEHWSERGGESRRARFWRNLNEQMGEAERLGHERFDPTKAEESIRESFASNLQDLFEDQLRTRPWLSEALPPPERSQPFEGRRRERARRVGFELQSIGYGSLELGVIMSASVAFCRFADEYPELIEMVLDSLAGQALDGALRTSASEFLEIESDLRPDNVASRLEPSSAVVPPGSALARVLLTYKGLIPILIALALLWVIGYNQYLDGREEKKSVQAMQKDLLDRQQKMIQLENAWILNLETKLLARAPPAAASATPASSPPAPSAPPAATSTSAPAQAKH